MFTDYDVIVLGSGCAGLAASIYTSRAGFTTLVLEKNALGGEMISRQLIENYPGFADGIMGPQLAEQMIGQAENAGAEFDTAEAVEIQDKGSFKIVKTADDSLTCKGIILATGSHPRTLQVPGEADLTGKGVFFCATCDGPRCAGKPVMVAGGGDSGMTEALHLVNLGCTVTIVEFMPTPKASQVLQDRVAENPNITVLCNYKTNAILGEDWVTGVEIENRETGEKQILPVQGLYTRIGQISNTEFLKGTLELSPTGQVPVNESMETVIPGICAAGDIRVKSPAQMSTAVGDGVTAAMSLGRYLNTLD
ncbi:MAG: FAD-dependent oxidoreductase [Clostridiales bacterium]|nr:FAD-dependent oxidoreductase [Clostridiales bacterium]